MNKRGAWQLFQNVSVIHHSNNAPIVLAIEYKIQDHVGTRYTWYIGRTIKELLKTSRYLIGYTDGRVTLCFESA